jgi:hypothetical protein
MLIKLLTSRPLDFEASAASSEARKAASARSNCPFRENAIPASIWSFHDDWPARADDAANARQAAEVTKS